MIESRKRSTSGPSRSRRKLSKERRNYRQRGRSASSGSFRRRKGRLQRGKLGQLKNK
jgi:hypothetical protein